MREGDGMPTVFVDPRARRSKHALEAALLELVADKDLAQISVSDITKHAGLSRSTFYEHYADVHSLAESACTVLFDELLEGTRLIDPQIVDSADARDNPLIPVFAHFGQHARLYRSLLGPDGSARVLNHLLHRIRVGAYYNRRIEAAVASTFADGPTDNPNDPEAAFVAGAIVGTVVDWLRRGCPGTPEGMAATVWPQLLGAVSVNGLGPRTTIKST
jgi:AcrR family transcriptional regulator